MLQQITSLMRSTLFSERRNGIKLLASYLGDVVDQPEPRPQVTILVSDALSEQNVLMQEPALVIFLKHFASIKFDADMILSPLLDIYKERNPATHQLVIALLVKILETTVYPARDLVKNFFGSATREQKLGDKGLTDLMHLLCQVSPVHRDTKQLYYDFLFNLDSIPVQFPWDLTTKVQLIVGTHFWNLEHQRKVRQVAITKAGDTFPVEGDLLPQFQAFMTALNKALAPSTLKSEMLDDILQRFPPFPLDQCLAPFFFIEATSVSKRHIVAGLDEFEIAGNLKSLLPVNLLIIGTETATGSPKRITSTVNLSGDFQISVQIRKMHQNYVPFTFYVDILGKQIPLTVPFAMPRPGDPAFHTNIFSGQEKAISVSDGTNGDYMKTICMACGENNAFRIEEIASPEPLYCKSCGILLKRHGELHLL